MDAPQSKRLVKVKVEGRAPHVMAYATFQFKEAPRT